MIWHGRIWSITSRVQTNRNTQARRGQRITNNRRAIGTRFNRNSSLWNWYSWKQTGWTSRPLYIAQRCNLSLCLLCSMFEFSGVPLLTAIHLSSVFSAAALTAASDKRDALRRTISKRGGLWDTKHFQFFAYLLQKPLLLFLSRINKLCFIGNIVRDVAQLVIWLDRCIQRWY